MRLCSASFAAALMLLGGILPLAHAAPVGNLDVLVAIGNEKIPLPNALAIDSRGKTFLGDASGHIDLRGAQGDLLFILDSEMIRARKRFAQSLPYSFKMTLAQAAKGIPAVFSNQEAPLAARLCRLHLERARQAVRRTMGAWERGDPVNKPITCILDGAAENRPVLAGNMLFLPPIGDNEIERGTTLIYQAYGMAVVGSLAGAPYDESLGFAAASLIAAYASSLEIQASGGQEETEWHEVRASVNRAIGSLRGNRLALRVFLSSLAILAANKRRPDTYHSAFAALTAFRRDGESCFLPGIERIIYHCFPELAESGSSNR